VPCRSVGAAAADHDFHNVLTPVCVPNASPAGDIHYMINSFSCTGAIVVGTFPLETNTTFLLPALAAFPAETQLMFGQTGFPAVAGTFPLVRDAACLARCGVAPPTAG
jgi:hypothetical protein